MTTGFSHLVPLYCLLYWDRPPLPSLSLPSCVKSATRKSLSPLEKGAYGTPLRVVSVVTEQLHPSPEGQRSTRFVSCLSGMMNCSRVYARIVAFLETQIQRFCRPQEISASAKFRGDGGVSVGHSDFITMLVARTQSHILDCERHITWRATVRSWMHLVTSFPPRVQSLKIQDQHPGPGETTVTTRHQFFARMSGP
jgi:hypothetical protein